MDIRSFINNYKNHPVLFIGAGFSLRYLENAHTWDGLLAYIAFELKGNEEFYLDIKSKHQTNESYDYTKIAEDLELEFNNDLEKNRHGKFKSVNDFFYSNMRLGKSISRFKIYISQITEKQVIKKEKKDEIAELKKIRKNVGSIITTNYDNLIESIFEFSPLVGNDILLSNPYGSIYKIHGCFSDPSKIIITEKDYNNFHLRYELIRAQLLSIFIHNPIIFIGYSITDENIKNLLKTIFTYVAPNSNNANKIRNNFLLVEYEKDLISHEISEHDIDLEGFSTIRINKIKTDDFNEIYKSISNLNLSVSAMDIRKVQDIVQEIFSGTQEDGTSIKVQILDDIDSLRNDDKVLAIGSSRNIRYEHRNSTSFIKDYFKIIEESNHNLIAVIENIKISNQQWFPIFGFDSINNTLLNIADLKENQINKINSFKESFSIQIKKTHKTITDINSDINITASNKEKAIFWSICEGNLSLEDIELYLKNEPNKTDTGYRRLLCAYDYKKYSNYL